MGDDRSPAPLAAFYSAPHRRRAANTVKSMACPGERPQEIYTPQPIVAALLRMWPHIELDPCHGPDSIVLARRHYYVPPTLIQTPAGRTKRIFRPGPGDSDGLSLAWDSFTYCNPPFALLREWMIKAALEARQHPEIAVLVPVRPHRTWWRDIRSTASATAWLNPVTFVDYPSAFPAPLALLYWGRLLENFKSAIAHYDLGSVEV